VEVVNILLIAPKTDNLKLTTYNFLMTKIIPSNDLSPIMF
jgi:hypothetical protein